MRKAILMIAIISLALSISLSCIYILDSQKAPDKIFDKTITSVVELRATSDEIEAFGTAVIISDTELITNFHVISYTNQGISNIHSLLEMRFVDESDYITVNLVKYDETRDLALLSMEEKKGEAISFYNGDIVEGQSVFLLGNANNLGISITSGIVSRSKVNIEINVIENTYIQVDAASASGVSGGALIDTNGKLIGILTLRILDKEGTPIYGYIFAIPISTILEFLSL